MAKKTKKKKWPYILGGVLGTLAIVGATLWVQYSPIAGFGDLSESISASDISAARAKFTTDTYKDETSGLSISYNVYLPKNYDSSKTYPMMVYIADSGSVGTTTENPLNYNFGGAVWALDSEQKKHESIVIVPNYPEIILDDHSGYTMTDYVDATGRMIQALSDKYSVDKNRIYGTGQSMGAMTTMYLAAQNPDLYAAMLIVDGQWDISKLEGLKSTKFIYIAAGGDAKASAGQQEVKAMLKEAGISYGELTDLNASASVTELNEPVQAMLDKGYSQNFITWKTGTVGWSTPGSGEHLPSFRFGYRVDVVRDWIYNQSKAN